MNPAPPRPPDVSASAPAPPARSAAEDLIEKQNARLDEELSETFPASDPIPYRHDP
ncbi:MAG TPA: hypothetical protein VIX87_05185 [Steroidobacteraceae bacterium]